MRNRFESTLHAIYTAALAALVFFTPLVFTTRTFESYEFPKMTFVYILGGLVILTFLVEQLLGGKKLSFHLRWVEIFVLANILSTIFSTHVYTSLWGYYTRFAGGLFSVLIFYGIYKAAGLLSENQWNRLFKLLATTMLPIGFYAIYQHWGAPESRVFSTFGQPNWLAAYSTVLIPVTLSYFLRQEGLEKRIWAVFYLLGFCGLWFSYSMSGLLGFLVSISVFLYMNKGFIKMQARPLSVLLVISIIISVLSPGLFKGRLNDAVTDFRKLFSLREVYALSESQYSVSDAGSIRKYLWKGTMRLVFSGPKNFFVGTGPETFAYEFQPFRPAELNLTSEWNFVFNKPHNYYLEILANLGAVGLAAYLGTVFSSLKKGGGMITPALTALYVTNFFGWPTVSTLLLFWLFLAYCQRRVDLG